ncbi:YqiA/YcfP family alpha/beta fold hydrolase [Desulfogranum japonicum]|uniref:YqiA/YcfP family alpha/beta fold hydrolase n=1 Tax=Desulfogranum japonicum TaxID=231447 RepID=UPI0005571FF3|nr:YqiA/YcfP family alpha/beta fold hydrolase [Desulfogranum japonicum]
MYTYFLHGLDSSCKGTKGQWFSEHFPDMQLYDFDGTLTQRMERLESICKEQQGLTLVGSSFGGLMATCFGIANPARCRSLILLAPALNFAEFSTPAEPITVPTRLIIGRHDDVCPPEIVLPKAEQTFACLTTSVVDDDHMLHKVFYSLPWEEWLKE